MNEKYYTPEIEEFKVGFEFEFMHSDYKEQGWKKYNTPEFNFEKEDCPFGGKDLSEYRVKYLDREDIESLGWSFLEKIGDSEVFKNYTGRRLHFVSISDPPFIAIKHSISEEDIFRGYCYNKTELILLNSRCAG